jgi:predicted transcriptional regulator
MAGRELVAISDAESVVMKVIWSRGTATTEEVVAGVSGVEQWQESTIKTLLNRLLKKGAISARKDGRRFVYSPELTHDEWVTSESRGFIDRLFDGRVAPLVSHFSRQRKLSKKDIEDIKRLIKELEDGR